MKMKSLILLILLSFSGSANADVTVKRVDFLESLDLAFNAAGPLFVHMDHQRNRLVVANTLSSSLTVIECENNSVKNFPVGGRALQHLKIESMAINSKTGDVCLVGPNCFYVASIETGVFQMCKTDRQFESVCFDENRGHVYLVGREIPEIGFYNTRSQELKMLKWVKHAEPLININQTTPPPLRKVFFDNQLNRLIALDGFTSQLYIFKVPDHTLERVRELKLRRGGRWHLAGYDQQRHFLYLAIETNSRNVVQAAKIDIRKSNDTIVGLPGLREGVGINYHSKREEIYVPYDNAASVHVIDFKGRGHVEEVLLPTFGNDATAIDANKDLLYIASWAQGEIDVVDLKSRSLVKRITGLGILPHMFNIAFNPVNNLIYIPRGATAVNGNFGAAVHALEPETEELKRIYTGWAPIDIIESPARRSFFVFSSENQFSEVTYDGNYKMHDLPYDYPICAGMNSSGNVYLSYGPHQSYWPTVYIWGAKNGILTIDSNDLSYYNRRIPRQALQIATEEDDALYFTQNNWGKEPQFLGRLTDEVRLFDIGNRIVTGDTVQRETTQRILRHDAQAGQLFLVRTGERSDDHGVLHIIDTESHDILRKVTVGLCPTDLVFDNSRIYVSNFKSNTVSVIHRHDDTVGEIETGTQPLRLCLLEGDLYCLAHAGKRLQKISTPVQDYSLPGNWLPDNVTQWGGRIVLTAHNVGALFIAQFDPLDKSFTLLHQEKYPYGDTRFDAQNASFFLNGQYGDAIPVITRLRVDQNGKLWVSDLLSGKLFIIEE
ncbi:MAG: hypothetical protein V2J62_10640 [candidate division KSB1 bacterium]|jgi:YVTN family beta-propeller protein|nr:hypothetical protein [candidate division KSB1 bacterium]